MASKAKYAALTWDDLRLYMRDLRTMHDLDVQFTLDYTACEGTFLRVTVKLYEGRGAWEGQPCLKGARGEMRAPGEGQVANIMYVINQAFVSYQADPWNWTLRDRMREARIQDV